ncbi:Glycoside hydrolase family 3 protein [Mycena kentingensis (nom. inval.)]|nr:Glycoside hydrolase family 3 protein [Mycena kentingensis (nom. inval.)]
MRPAVAALLGLSCLARFVVHAAFPDCTAAPLAGMPVCDTSLSAGQRAQTLIANFTTAELIANTVFTSPGVARLGLPAYTWWSEALHGVADSPGVTFPATGDFRFATSFPEPILISAAFDDDLVEKVAEVISTEARAFNNFGHAGLDFFTPNINPFRDPRWGRGLETPGEDAFRNAEYVFRYVKGLQGGIDPPLFKTVADCKHFAGYDIETSRTSFNAVISQQELAEYYLLPFQSCVRDAKVGSVMCSYNAVNGVPSCADTYLLTKVLREKWGFDEDRWVTSDCDAVANFVDHGFSPDLVHAAATGMNAGTDQDCGSTYSRNLGAAVDAGLVNVSTIQRALTRQYTSLVRLGYFDPPASQPFRQLTFADVNTPDAQALAYQAAVQGIALLKNDGTLPLAAGKSVAIIGPWANATNQMQGNYEGVAPFLISPLAAARAAGLTVNFAPGAAINSADTSGFAAAIAAAQASDVILYFGGIDLSIEAEGRDRQTIVWPATQLDLLGQLQAVGKPLVVSYFGAGQIDSSSLKSSDKVNAILWGGYPGQSGGTAIFDIITGKVSPAGRLPVTQYPAAYTSQVPITDMNLRPSTSSGNPGRTYMWFTGEAVYPFGSGLSYSPFTLTFAAPHASYDIQSLISSGGSGPLDLALFDNIAVSVQNRGEVMSDYVVLLFLQTTAGPAPFPESQLVGYTRAKTVPGGATARATVKVTLGSVARTDESGASWLFPGEYTLLLDVPGAVTQKFTLTGTRAKVNDIPSP